MMMRTGSQTTGTPRASPIPSPHRNSREPPPTDASRDNMNDDNVNRSIAVTLPCESGEAKTFLPPVDFDNIDTTGRSEEALRTLEVAPW